MRHRIDSLARTLGLRLLGVTAILIAPAFPGWPLGRIEHWIVTRPAGRRRLLVGCTVGLMFVLALIAAQFGVIGLGLYFLGVMLVVR